MTKQDFLKILRALEWSTSGGGCHYCPSCRLMAHHADMNKRLHPHSSDCALDACITMLEAQIARAPDVRSCKSHSFVRDGAVIYCRRCGVKA